MGSLCGKESPPSGHALGSGSAPSRTPLLPSFMSKKPKVGGPGRTLGGSSSGYDEIEGANGEQSNPADARAAAALAAEQRSNTAQKNGKLAAQLEQQKRKTHNQHIQDLAKSNGQQEQLVWD